MFMGSWCGLHVDCIGFFVFLCGFALDGGVLVEFHLNCIVYYRVSGLRCVGGRSGTQSFCLSTVSFLL